MKTPADDTSAFDQQSHLQVVDALRGYAILLVIAVHSIGLNQALAWPAKRLLLLGFYGVQLFFLASALTLLMSWSRSQDRILPRSGKFLIRRFFRIAPLYYLAVVFYWFAYHAKPEDFTFELLIATLFFYNAWSPFLIPTVPGWTPVPGGWSISVEFCFYFIFPLMAIATTSLKRALLFFAAALTIMLLASYFGRFMYPEIDPEARANFLYFWPPNQLIVFALGFVLYHCVKNREIQQWLIASRITANSATVILGLSILALSFYGPRKFFESYWLPPTHLLISLLFLAWALVLVIKPKGFAINSAIIGLGKVSFSAYILHFSILKYVGTMLHASWPFPTDGMHSVAYSFSALAIALVATRYVAALTYRFIEMPFINLGKSVIRNLYSSRASPIPEQSP